MTDNEIAAGIITYGDILDRSEKAVREVASHIERLNGILTELVKCHDDAGRKIEELARQMEDKEKAEAVIRLMTGTALKHDRKS